MEKANSVDKENKTIIVALKKNKRVEDWTIESLRDLTIKRLKIEKQKVSYKVKATANLLTKKIAIINS